jgi:hypothetical protein
MNLNKSTQTAFRSFVEGSVLLVLIALLSTVSVTRLDPVNAETTRDSQTVRASLLPDITAATPPPATEESDIVWAAPESTSSCNFTTSSHELRAVEVELERILSRSSRSLKILERDGDKLIIRILRTERTGQEAVRLPV